MKLAIVHLSDLHISSKDVIHKEKISALVDSLQLFHPFNGAIIAFSGDIAGKGNRNEYKLAKRFIGSLVSELQTKYKLRKENVKVLLVPGNHDMNREIAAQAERNSVETWHDNKALTEHIAAEMEKMSDFYSFADQEKCYFAKDKKPFTRKILPFIDDGGEKYYVEANLFNSAPFSSDNDNGIHFMPKSVFSLFDMWSPAQLTLSIMHHSPDWFWPEQKVELQESICSRSNLVFYGHEHYESAQRLSYNKEGLAFIQAGGAWWDQKQGFAKSSYYAGIFDSVSRNYRQYQFVWNEKSKFYAHSNCIEEVLPDKSVRTAQFVPTKEYISNLLHSEEHAVASDFRKYYVFPTLQLEEPGDYDIGTTVESEEKLLEIIENHDQIMILGGNNSGRTTLLKSLFLKLSQKYTVLLCGPAEIAGKNQANIIRTVFQDVYGSDQTQYKRFEQQAKREKIIVIDDADEIKPAHLNKLLTGLSDQFEHIIIGSRKDDTSFDIREQICTVFGLEQGICQLKISKFYANKRRELIGKLVTLFNDELHMDSEFLVSKIDKALSAQNMSFKLDPDFIVKFSTYYCSHINELQVENINVFSKVFEASIELAIMPHLHRETVGQIKTVLSEVAYYVHFQKCYPITVEQIDAVVKEYSRKYEENITTERFLEIAIAANLLKKGQGGITYRFKNKDYLAYFVAMALSRHFNEGDESSEKDLTYIIDYSCFSINSTVLKYIAYTTENIRIIDILLEQAIHFVEHWSPYDIDSSQFEYLRNIKENGPITIKGGEREREIEEKAKREKELDKNTDVIETIGLYDYDEASADEIVNQLIRSTRQMNVIASTLPIFSHIMRAPVKRKLIETLYDMPNRIFNHWATGVDEQYDSIVKEFVEEFEPLNESERQEGERKIKGMLQKLSANLLLNLYYTVARTAVTPTTIMNLTRDDYATNTNRCLERMMLWEEADEWASFTKEAEAMYEKCSSIMVKNMIQAMVYHMLIWSTSLPVSKRHHLMDKFKFNKSVKHILFQSKNAK